MGLFSGGKAAEEEISYKLRQNPMVGMIVSDMAASIENDEKYQYLTMRAGWYDNGRREVIITPDRFAIVRKWDEHIDGKTVPRVEVLIKYSYTSAGYRPLHGNGKGITTLRVMALWAEVMRDAMKQKTVFSSCRFASNMMEIADEDQGYASFSYYCPELPWKDWY